MCENVCIIGRRMCFVIGSVINERIKKMPFRFRGEAFFRKEEMRAAPDRAPQGENQVPSASVHQLMLLQETE